MRREDALRVLRAPPRLLPHPAQREPHPQRKWHRTPRTPHLAGVEHTLLAACSSRIVLEPSTATELERVPRHRRCASCLYSPSDIP